MSDAIVKIITQINNIYEDTVSFLKNKIASSEETKIKSKIIIVSFF